MEQTTEHESCRTEQNHTAHDECCCGHCHSHDHDDAESSPVKKILLASVFFAAGLLVQYLPIFSTERPLMMSLSARFHSIENPARIVYGILYLAAYLVCGRDVLKGAVRNILKGDIFGEQFLMSVASLGALFLGEFAEAVAVLLFYTVGEYVQDYAVDKSRNSISALMNIRPDKANLVRNGKAVSVSPEEVEPGEIIEVNPGERVPLDGIVIEGNSFADTSALTGESVPRAVSAEKNSAVLAGFINQSGLLTIKVTKSYGESAVTRILKLTQEAGENKSKSEKFISRFAKVYTPIVCIAALGVAVLPPLFISFFMPELLASYGWSVWLYRALSFLVVSCPCALVLSVPLAFFCGIGAASKRGILIKGSNYMEFLSEASVAVFDKTGTLTKGIFDVREIHPENGISEEELLAAATHAESHSNHPISKSLKKSHHCVLCDSLAILESEEFSGMGVKAVVDGKQILAGNARLMETNRVNGFVPRQAKTSGTTVHVAIDGLYAGSIVIRDEEKEDSAETIANLKKEGIRKTVMLTGDTKENAEITAAQLGIDSVFAQLLPEDKIQKVAELIAETAGKKGGKRNKVIFVGDGINDSPVLARADVGIAMGALGSDAAIEASDIVIMDDKPAKIIDALRLSRKTMSVVRQNILLSVGIKIAIMVLNTLGIGNMWTAVFGDVGVCILAICNAALILRHK